MFFGVRYSIPRASGGNSDEPREIDTDAVVFPARAGVIPGLCRHYRVAASIPRASGGNSERPWEDPFPDMYSPRERG